MYDDGTTVERWNAQGILEVQCPAGYENLGMCREDSPVMKENQRGD